MRVRGVLYGLGIIAVGLFGWIILRRHNVRTDAQVTAQTLPAGDKAKVIIDEKRHEIITVAEAPRHIGDSGPRQIVTTKRFLAPNASIETKPDGTVVVTSRSWGTELSPWVGISIDSEKHARVGLCVNWFYWQRLELGSGLSIRTSDLDPRVFVSAGYNVYSNLLLNATIDNHKAIGIGVALKF